MERQRDWSHLYKDYDTSEMFSFNSIYLFFVEKKNQKLIHWYSYQKPKRWGTKILRYNVKF